MNQYLYVGMAVIADAIGAAALKSADGFRVLLPSVLAVIGYGSAFYFLALAVRTIPIGVANALWSGLSIVLVAIVGCVVHRQSLDAPALVGMLLIFTGTVLLNVGSKVVWH
jgi:small multidrug resistance pump